MSEEKSVLQRENKLLRREISAKNSKNNLE